jgi:hypothetical protein
LVTTNFQLNYKEPLLMPPFLQPLVSFKVALLLQLVVTAYMVGVIWLIQLVHYPLLQCLAPLSTAEFITYTQRHVSTITWVVGPAMLLEAVLGVWCLWQAPKTLQGLCLLGAGLLLVIWASTALLQVPCHAILQQRFDANVIGQLVASNWVRTVAWTVKLMTVIVATVVFLK